MCPQAEGLAFGEAVLTTLDDPVWRNQSSSSGRRKAGSARGDDLVPGAWEG
jgi:hypothetical protein